MVRNETALHLVILNMDVNKHIFLTILGATTSVYTFIFYTRGAGELTNMSITSVRVNMIKKLMNHSSS